MPSISEEEQSEHMACVVGAVTQAAAALEARFGSPKSRTGAIIADAMMVNRPFADMISSFIFSQTALNDGERPYQDADLLNPSSETSFFTTIEMGRADGRCEAFFYARVQLRFDKPMF